MNINLIKNYQKGSVVIGVLISLSVVICGGLLSYTWKQLLPAINAANQSKIQLKSDISELKTKISELGQTQTVVNRIKPSLSSLELALPNNDQFPEMLVMIEAMAKSSGLSEVSALEIGTSDTAATNTNNYKPATFSITGLGFYENAIVFLDNLYNNIRTVEINSVALTTKETSSSESGGTTTVPGQLNFTFSGYTYSRPDKKSGSVNSSSTSSTSSTSNSSNNSSNTTSSSQPSGN